MNAHAGGFGALVAARRRLGALRVGISLAAYLVACGAFVVLRGESMFLAVLAIFGVSLLAIRLNRVVRGELNDGVSTSKERWSLIGGVAATGAGLLVAWYASDGLDGAGFFGVALLYVAIGVGLEEIRGWRDVPPRRFALVFVVSVAVTVGGLVTVWLGAERALLVVLAAGVLGVPTGLTLVSELASRELQWRSSELSVALAAGGLAGLGATSVVLVHRGVGAVYVSLFVAACVLFMLGMVARSSIDVVFVVAAAAVVWTLSHRSVPEPAELRPDPGQPVLVGMGDSFISGEGAEVYFEGTNQPGVSTCRRAPTAYPVLLVQERGSGLPTNLVFVACSGATTDGIEAQLDALGERVDLAAADVEFVLLSIGGNDALFGTIAQACLLPIDCTRLESAWLAHLAEVRDKLDAIYADLAQQLPGVPVVVVPYPEPIAPTPCAYSAFSSAEHRFLDSFARQLNQTVADAAANAGFALVDTMPDALDGLRLCDGPAADVGVNFLAANSVLGTLEQSANPLNWVHNSLHPNARGHHAMRDAVVAWLADGPDLTPDPVPVSVPEIDELSGTCVGSSDLERCSRDWMAREMAWWLLTRGLLGIPALAGAWLVALGVLRFWWAVFGDQRGDRVPR